MSLVKEVEKNIQDYVKDCKELEKLYGLESFKLYFTSNLDYSQIYFYSKENQIGQKFVFVCDNAMEANQVFEYTKKLLTHKMG
jgi:hypothetical protein